jgi:hypothetical protein
METKQSAKGAKARTPKAAPGLEDAHYAALAGFRRALRQVMADSESICAGLGLTTQRFQALLAIRAFPGQAMSVGDLLGSGTISGDDKAERGSLLELSWNGTEPLALATQLEKARVSMAGQTGFMRAQDHQFQQPLVVGVMERQGGPGVKFDVEGSGYGFRVIRQLSAEQARLPSSCAMVRPG